MKRFSAEAARPDRPGTERRRHHSIRISLIALVTACVLPAIVAIGILVYEDYLQGRDAVNRETMLRARGLMATIDRDLAKVESSLQVLAASQRLTSPDLTSFALRLRTTPRSLLVLNYVVIDRNGKELLNSVAPIDAPIAAIAAPPEMLKVFASGEPVISTLFEGPLHRQLCIAMTVPVTREGEIVYGLTAELLPSQLGRILEDAALPDGWVAALLDRHGTIVARSKSGRRLVGRQAGTALVDSVMRRAEGTLDTINRDGVPVITSHTRSSMSGLSLVVNAPRSILLSKLSSSFALLIAGGTLTLCIVLWFAVRLARDVTRSVEALIEPALALGSGRPVVLPDTQLTEADAVGQAIVQASRMLTQAKHQAHHDALTGLCNRLLFDEVASHWLASARRHRQQLAILAIDLDHFKEVNDRHGHAAGDRVLKVAAERIRRTIRESDVVSRRGGDEFTVLLGDVDPILTDQIAEKLVHALGAPYPDVLPAVSASIGIALFPEAGPALDDLLARADGALYEAKKAGKGRVAGDRSPSSPMPTADQRVAA